MYLILQKLSFIIKIYVFRGAPNTHHHKAHILEKGLNIGGTHSEGNQGDGVDGQLRGSPQQRRPRDLLVGSAEAFRRTPRKRKGRAGSPHGAAPSQRRRGEDTGEEERVRGFRE